jgi:hypothetical protein
MTAARIAASWTGSIQGPPPSSCGLGRGHQRLGRGYGASLIARERKGISEPPRAAVGALAGLPWGGLVRIFFVHHITWSVTSVCPLLSSRRFETDDESTNAFWLALPSLGESWHHNHHMRRAAS